ncbi:MAG: response regulator [Dehalococcoidia bacterium]
MELEPARILIVEDDQITASVLTEILQDAGHTVEWVSTGARGFDRLAEGDADLVLLDLLLPEMNGFDVCRLMREREGRRRVPVIALSGFSEARDRARALDSGADDYLSKPFAIDELLARIDLRPATPRSPR